MLPLDDFYQVPTTWGYYGSDVVPTQLITRPTIARHPQAYIGDPAGFEQLRDAVEAGLVGRDPSAATSGNARARCLVRRRAQGHRLWIADPGGRHAAPTAITAVSHTRGTHLVASTAVADVYEFADGDAPVEALSGTIAAPNARAGALAALVSTAPAGTAIVTGDPKGAPLLRRVLVAGRESGWDDHAAISR